MGFILDPVNWFLVNSGKLLIGNQRAVRTQVLQCEKNRNG